MLSNLRYALRSLMRSHYFTLITVTTLAIGVGAAASIFSVTDWALFRSYPFPDKERLFVLGWKSKEVPSNPFLSGACRYEAYRKQSALFSGLAAMVLDPANAVFEGEPEPVLGVRVSSDWFSTFGLLPALGRGFVPEEFRAGTDNVAVISHRFWQKHFDQNPEVLGRKLRIGREICSIVGVLPEGARPPLYADSDVFRPLVLTLDQSNPWRPLMFVVGRLNPGVSSRQAAAALAAVNFDVAPQFTDWFRSQEPLLIRLDELKKVFRPEIYWLLVGAVAFLYSIACLNATNLILARFLGRRRELSIRLALGGGRRHVIGLLMAESTGLSLVATAVGVLAARWIFPMLLRFARGEPTVGATASLDWRTLGIMGVLGVFTSILIAVIPAVQVFRADIQDGLKEGGAALGESRGLGRLRGMLVVLQAAFAVILLAGAGLMVSSIQKLQHVNLGFEPARKVKVQVLFPDGYRFSWEERLRLFEDMGERLRKIPGVRNVAFGTDSILSGVFFTRGRLRLPAGGEIQVRQDAVSAEFLQAAGLTLLRGRWLGEDSNMVWKVVINESLARKRFGDANPVGQIIEFLPDGLSLPNGVTYPPLEVIGVVRDVRGNVREAPDLHMYCGVGSNAQGLSTFVLQMNRETGKELESVVRRIVYDFDPYVRVSKVQTIDALIADTLWMERLTLSVLKVLSAFAFVLAIVGMFSVIAYSVDRRTGEFGVRMALGATPADLVWLVFRRAITLSVGGVVIGIAGALGLTRFMQSLLYETQTYDPLVHLLVAAALLAATAVACWLPARRATRIDIASLLKAE